MARATRSTTTNIILDNSQNKKRKRSKVDDNDGENPNTELDNADTNDESPPPKRQASESSIAANDSTAATRDELVHHPGILNILELVDSQGLLDRVFPVLEHPGLSLSLRALLQEPRQLAVLRAAVEYLTPIASTSRAAASTTADQQRRFCDLALSLLDQAAARNAPVPLSLSTVLPTSTNEATSSSSGPLKYALLQHLPSGDYWTSLNSESALTDALTQLPTAHAELVAILPTPPLPAPKPVSTLATYSSKAHLTVKPLPTQRSVSTASFLDYGPYSSFAPSFDHNAQIVGREELGEVLYSEAQKVQDNGRGMDIDPELEEISASARLAKDNAGSEEMHSALEELFSAEEAAAIEAALHTLEMERAVYELLERSRKALVELELMQITRLAKEGASSIAEEGSVEWDTAQGLLGTLTLLASLRPRASTSTSSEENPASIIPSPSVLHKLHRTLAFEPSQGWNGTLPPAQTTALVDNNTVKKSKSVPTPAPTAATPTPAAAATAAAAAPPTSSTAVPQPVAMSYSSYYPYTQGQAAGQPMSATPYRPQVNGAAAGATTTPYSGYGAQYYPHYTQMQSYYGQQQQGYTAVAHSYPGWFPYHHQQPAGGAAAGTAGYGYAQQPQAAAAAVGSSGRGTPQPQAQAAAVSQPAQATPGVYGSYFGGQQNGNTARTPVVANTVAGAATYGNVAGQAGVTLPAHLRASQGSYYTPGYQPQQTQAASVSPAGQT